MQDDFSPPTTFLDELEACWGREPRVWRNPFAIPYATAEHAFACLCELRQRLEAADRRFSPRIYVDGKQRGILYDRHLPDQRDLDLAGYQRRLVEQHGDARVGLVVPDAQALDDRLWRRALRITRLLFERVGFPAGGSHSEIFLGNYRESFFRLHKDHLDTLTFVTAGRKRLLVWPFSVFADEPGVPADAELKQVHFEERIDWQARRGEAIVLEGGPGDVFYWPASYWHVAEAVDDDFVTTFTLAYFATSTSASGSPFRLAHEALSRAGVEGLELSDPALPAVHRRGDKPETRNAHVEQALAAMQRQLERHVADPSNTRARREHSLLWLSALGFQNRPVERSPEEIPPNVEIYVDPHNPVIWTDVSPDGFPCAVNGIVLTTLPKFLPLVEHLNAGGTFRVDDLRTRFVTGEGDDPLTEEELFGALSALHSARFFETIA